MPKSVPIKDMRDTAAFLQLVESCDEPVTVTKNGYDRLVVLTPAEFDEYRHDRARARLLDRIALAERERAEGITLDLHQSIADLRSRYGL